MYKLDLCTVGISRTSVNSIRRHKVEKFRGQKWICTRVLRSYVRTTLACTSSTVGGWVAAEVGENFGFLISKQSTL